VFDPRNLPASIVLPADVDRSLIVPRVCRFPEYAYSSGLEAVEVAAQAGLILDPWQSLALQLGLGETALGRWAAFQVNLMVSRQNGKGSVLEALGLFWLFVTGERLIGHSAHEYKTAMEAFRRIVALIDATDWMRAKVKKIINTNGEEGIELVNGQRMRFLARSKGSGRGFSFDKIIWDEAYALTPGQVDAQLPTLSARPNPQVWLTSSPPLDSVSGEPMFGALRLALADGPATQVFMDYGWDSTLDKIKGCANPRCTHLYGRETGCVLDDRKAWARTNPAHPHRITLEAIERERRTMAPLGFARERMGIWPPDLQSGFGVISKVQWHRMRTEAPADAGRTALAIDVSPRIGGQVNASIGAAVLTPEGMRQLELVVSGSGTSWIVAHVVKVVAANPDIVAVAVDPGGPAGSLLPDLQNAIGADGKPAKLPLVTMGTRDVAQAFGMIYDAATAEDVEDRNVTHLGQQEMALAVAGAGKRPVGDGHAWDRRNPATDITPLVACTHALWALASYQEPATVEPWAVYA